MLMRLFLFLITLLSFSILSAQQDTVIASATAEHSFVLYFRRAKDILHKDYMDNERALRSIDELFSNPLVLEQMDSISISATSSPEGHPLYNYQLSFRRAQEVKRYLEVRYPLLQEKQVSVYALGEDWSGFERLVFADPDIPYKEEVLSLIHEKISLVEKERRLRLIGGGVAFDYISKYMLKYLRTGATCVAFYPKAAFYDLLMKKMEATLVLPPPLEMAPISLSDSRAMTNSLLPDLLSPSYQYIRPIAFKTNLLFDLATILNVEVEIPIAKHFSLMGEWMFPWWGGLASKTNFTLQMLYAGVEARYWFWRPKKLAQKATRWHDYNPLNGFFAGVYTGAGLYDFQLWGDGIQGELFIAAGLSLGFAHPIGKHFHMEYSLGAGYLQTDYRFYTPMDDHKVYQSPHRFSLFNVTKAKISLVYIPQIKIKTKKGGRL